MPNFALHALLASNALDAWRSDARAPFDASNPDAANAFLHGAVAPDMGLYPGGDRLVSDVVHHFRTGAFVRALLHAATRPAETAFAWGWLTHVIADAELHPLVNRDAATALGPTASHTGDARLLVEHVRIELGLDSEYLTRYPRLRHARLRPAFDRRFLAYVQRCLHAVYGATFDGAALLGSHHAVLRLHRHVLLLGRFVAHDWGYRAASDAGLALAHPVLAAARWFARLTVEPSSPAAGFLHPVRPAPALLRAVDDLLARMPALLADHSRDAMERVPDIDLETGLPEDPARPSARALEALRALAGRAPASIRAA